MFKDGQSGWKGGMSKQATGRSRRGDQRGHREGADFAAPPAPQQKEDTHPLANVLE